MHAATREHPQIQVGASPRGGLALVQLARGQAVLQQRDYVIPDDVKNIAVLRMVDGKNVRFKFNFKDFARGKNPEQDILLKPGDTVIVP